MKKTMIVIAGLTLVLVGAWDLRADDAEDRVFILKSIVRSSVEANDYGRITEALSAVSDTDSLSWSNEDIAYFKTEILKAAAAAENTVDPQTTGAMLDEASRVFPNDFDLSVKLLKSYLEVGQFGQARELAAELSVKYAHQQEDAEFSAAFFANKAVDLIMDGDYDVAKADLEITIEKDPNWTGGYFLMAALMLKVNDAYAAEKNLKKCLELNPNHEGARKVLDEVLPRKRAGDDKT
jgi:tetratricopeptide (TPR) repeat protein